ncbi:MAG TPA: CCA tRNA nucleotidyltransferase [Longimicrobiales bacterium]|nr:CCA tRNA nucleotidyltransferase [Longimicrobiales bacterium]
MRLPVPAVVCGIAARLEEAGFETWAVGGAIRDALFGLPARGDWDLTTAATPTQVRRLFRRTVPIGVEHGTVGVLDDEGVMHEVTTFRRDVETTGRHAVVEFGASLEEDLARRDFTINAIAYHPLRDELRDPHGGQRDIRSRRLRTVGDARTRFAEDYLRVLRALRFAGRFGLEIDPDTWAAIPVTLDRLPGLSGERVREELWKVIKGSRDASTALALYQSSGVLAVLYPELAETVGLRADENEPVDAWGRALRAVDALPPTRALLRVAALLHPVGMPAARARSLRGGFSFTGHPIAAARRAEEVMRRLKASNADTEHVRRLVLHQEDFFPPDAPDSGIRRWLRDVGPDLVPDLVRLRIALERADAAAAGRPIAADVIQRVRAVRRLLSSRPPLVIGDLAIGGAELTELGIPPGPRYGEILRALLDEVIEQPELNTREGLMERVRRDWSQ